MQEPIQPDIDRAKKLAHELHVHQIELECQNEELRRTQSDLAAARDRYLDLFDFAPVGYLTLDKQGVVLECNLTSAELLGVLRSGLNGASLSRFVMPADSDRWHLYLRRVLQEEHSQCIELALRHADLSNPWYGEIVGQRVVTPNQVETVRVTVTDITGRVQADAERRIAAIDSDERESERQRVALQLHEDLGQRLSALKMDLCQLLPSGVANESSERLSGALVTVDAAIATVRRITMDLRPPMLDDLGLVPAIEWLVRDTVRRLGLPLTISLCAEPFELGEHTRLAVFRFVQKALALLVHHTGGSHLHVGMRNSGSEFDLVLRTRPKVQNEAVGRALDPQAVSMLEHRARLLGGRLKLDEPRDHFGWIGMELSLPSALQHRAGAIRSGSNGHD